MINQKKTKQQEEGENIFIKIAKLLFVSKKYEIRSASLIDEMNGKDGKRLVVFLRGNDDEES